MEFLGKNGFFWQKWNFWAEMEFLGKNGSKNNFQLCLSHCTERHRTWLQWNLSSAAVGRFWRIDWSPAAEVSNYSKYYMLSILHF